MYEQYTDKQIVETIALKLEKLGWGPIVDYLERYPSTCKVLAAIYRSAYIRGQLGWSSIIGEPKQTEYWVPATKDNIKVDSKVRMADNILYKDEPLYFPAAGTVGTIVNIYDGTPLVQWPSKNTSEKDRWFCPLCHLEVLLCE